MTEDNLKRRNFNKKTQNKLRTVPGIHLEADSVIGGMSVIISGAVGIGELSEEKISIASPKGCIEIRGQRLRATVFEGARMRIFGSVTQVSFIYSKSGARKINVKT